MKVAVLGAGAIGLGTAAFLCQRGHDPILWSPTGKSTEALAGGAPLVASGAVAGSFRPQVAMSSAEAIAGADAVLIAVPGYGHRAVIDAAAPHLEAGRTIIVSSHCSLSALYLSKRLAERGVAAPIAAWGSTVVTARRAGPASVTVSNVRERFDIATLPASDAGAAIELCRGLFGDRFEPRADLLAISLSNLNPQNHMGMALCNLTRIERGEAWGNYACITPSVGRLIEALDRERLAIADAFGATVRTVRDHFHLSYGVPRDEIGEMARQIAGRGDPPGPTSLATRYVTEDVPYGLVATSLLARIADVAAPLHNSGIDIFSALYGRDFRRENDLLPELGLDGISTAALRRRTREGWTA